MDIKLNELNPLRPSIKLKPFIKNIKLRINNNIFNISYSFINWSIGIFILGSLDKNTNINDPINKIINLKYGLKDCFRSSQNENKKIIKLPINKGNINAKQFISINIKVIKKDDKNKSPPILGISPS